VLSLLHIAFQDGFEDDLVIVQIDGREVFQKEGIKTNLLIGYADSVEVQVPEGSLEVKLLLPSKNLTEIIELKVSEDVYLGLSIRNRKVDYIISQKPFGYL
jgi:hypothetical protein